MNHLRRRPHLRRRKWNPTHVISRRGLPDCEVQLLKTGEAIRSAAEQPKYSLFLFSQERGWTYRNGKPLDGVVQEIVSEAA